MQLARMLKPARMQYSCTCLQYDIDLDKVPKVLEMAKEMGFAVEPFDVEGCIKKGHILKRAIEAELTSFGDDAEDMSLEYSSEEDNYCVPDDFQRALDCLRLSYIAADHSSGCCFPYGEPAPVISTNIDYSLQTREQNDVYIVNAVWLFSSITNRCNLDCSFCYNKKGPGEISAEDFARLAEKFRQGLKKGIKEPGVTLGGGEPTIHPELEKIAEKAKEKIGLVTLTTNGTNKKRLISIKDYLDGVCVSTPFIYTEELKEYCGQSNEKIKENTAAISEQFDQTCIATIITNKMQPEDVFKIDALAEELGATNTLFLLYKPVGDNKLMPTKKQARKILEKILELAFKKKNTAIDCCLAEYTARAPCMFHYAKPDGILKTSGWEQPCPFDQRYDCLIKK